MVHLYQSRNKSEKIFGDKERIKRSYMVWFRVSSPQSVSDFNLQVVASQQGLVHFFKTHTEGKWLSIFFYRLGALTSGTR